MTPTPESTAPAANTACSVYAAGISADYGAVRALENVELALPRGQFIAVVGPNGAGKSTLFKLLTGTKRPSSGAMMVNGQDIRHARRANAVGYVPQETDIDWDFPIRVWDVVLSGRYGRCRQDGGLRRFLPPRFIGHSHHEQARQALQRMEIAELANRPIGALSGGQKKRVFLARALAQEPQILLLDEPLAGVDRHSEQIILGILREQCRNGRTVLMVTHDLPTVRETADMVVLVNRTIVAVGNPAEMLAGEALERGYHRPEVVS
ncbi:metal ABC transporter ATP-binding protein [Spirochaeta africana]|uniref:ATPase component of Mn/Zn ABC-type transporter n=1 Tax=Spirochaeta africana (strain ATCC 700263 / DSM 8902 / Z-7692) TaxID=889378 RepID=H9UGR8_SPIAZ|nr:metal ABC transporter ATP-binding protein [Spirochaeta africana]AFG36711.1 ATPase component of Mn/Zn ABC-type transporter [Spirochaeta africana DSM 8902]